MKFGKQKVGPTEMLVNAVVSEVGASLIEEARQLRSEVRELRELQNNELQNLGKQLTNAWLGPIGSARTALHFDDPIWGQVSISQRLAPLFGHPLVQRLNYIKQLSFAYLTFPSATHSRMSHSLGVCRLVERALTTVFRNDVVYTENGAETIGLSIAERETLLLKAQTVALLHDLGHAPFGHALDRLLGFLDANKP